NWYNTLTAWLNSISFYESTCDPCLYSCNGKVSFVFFHLGDLILVGQGNKFKKELEKRFRNSSCQEPNTILGMKFKREDKKIKLSLPNHIQTGLKELDLVGKTSATPRTPSLKHCEYSEESHARFKKLNMNYR
ncbi:uncharacterized protein VP01_9316g1, partial [Puccinia sorghi]